MMKTMPFKEIRKNLTNIAIDVQYSKEFFVFTKNNKPCIGVVPAEMLLLLAKIFQLAKTIPKLAKLTDEYGLYLTTKEFKFIESHLKNHPKESSGIRKSIRAAKNKFNNNIDYSDIPAMTADFWKNAKVHSPKKRKS